MFILFTIILILRILLLNRIHLIIYILTIKPFQKNSQKQVQKHIIPNKYPRNEVSQRKERTHISPQCSNKNIIPILQSHNLKNRQKRSRKRIKILSNLILFILIKFPPIQRHPHQRIYIIKQYKQYKYIYKTSQSIPYYLHYNSHKLQTPYQSSNPQHSKSPKNLHTLKRRKRRPPIPKHQQFNQRQNHNKSVKNIHFILHILPYSHPDHLQAHINGKNNSKYSIKLIQILFSFLRNQSFKGQNQGIKHHADHY